MTCMQIVNEPKKSQEQGQLIQRRGESLNLSTSDGDDKFLGFSVTFGNRSGSLDQTKYFTLSVPLRQLRFL